MMDIGTHVKVHRMSHIGRKKQTFNFKHGVIVKYYPYGRYYLVDFGLYKECYKKDELIRIGE